MLIAILTMFFCFSGGGSDEGALLPALLLTVFILAGILATFGATALLSKTVLNGVPSSFTLELPPYRRPKLGAVIVRSVFDRTLFVLGRAAAVAAPAGLIIWLTANIPVGEASLLLYLSSLLDAPASLLGLDGVILIAFILGFPANEIVVPIMIMAYTASGTLVETESVSHLRELFISNGWTMNTAVCFLCFALFHWPCSTTVLTIKKETGSLKWTALAVILPTATGTLLCMIINLIFRLLF